MADNFDMERPIQGQDVAPLILALASTGKDKEENKANLENALDAHCKGDLKNIHDALRRIVPMVLIHSCMKTTFPGQVEKYCTFCLEDAK